ncbi:putative short chain dehydrogenase/ reductase [Durotheca rogersii]|uniref:putative short chain dehydrogenase/ reductase n=1 Tax=Durotheca rogersii TaxID=419775 RepID=UPI00221FBBCA|nr:putative short chain dehydrogenase/ reductase [Durotheca rogersii]KAI5867267.1 putative short chain dehydrogenase/ reductase [Durotheca rogersii]
MASFENKLVVITGAASGIGRATAKILASRGALLSLSDVSETGLKTLKEEIQSARGDAAKGTSDGTDPVFTSPCDVRSQAACDAWIAGTMAHFAGRKIDGAANLAGVVTLPQAAACDGRDSSDAEIDFIFGVNVRGTINCLRSELPHMREAGVGAPAAEGSAIVNAGSLSGLMGLGGYMPYVASKHAVIGITRTVAKEEAPRGIRVNAIAPGLIDTPMLQAVAASMGKTASADMYGRGPTAALGRLGTDLEVAEVVAFLLSPQSGYITGQPITIDGGMSCAG